MGTGKLFSIGKAVTAGDLVLNRVSVLKPLSPTVSGPKPTLYSFAVLSLVAGADLL